MSSRWQLKYIRRRREIVGTFMRHGMGYFLQRFGFNDRSALKNIRTGITPSDKNQYLLATNLRQALVELGPTFVKLGQLLSTRPDILRPVFIEELEKLQDKVDPICWEELQPVLDQEMGPIDKVFAEFDPNPLAAASIGQVHRARLLNGEEVIVKVQRPGVEAKVRNDFEILKGLARISEQRSAEARRLGILAMVEDYRRTLLRELDYEREARNTERVYKNFADDPRVIIPRVFKEYSSPRVLVQEYIEGIKLSDIEKIDKKGLDRRKISALGTEAFLSQILLHGFFQADPHPGNIFVVDNEHIAFIDFGEIGYLSDLRLAYVGEMLIAVMKNDPYRAMSVMRDMGILDQLQDSEDFSESFAELVESLYASSIGNLDMKRMRIEIMEFSFRYHLKMPSYLTSLMKALITVEGLGKKLDPKFDFSEVASPLAQKVYRERLKPSNLGKFLRSRYYKEVEPLKVIPANFNRLLQDTADGRLTLHLDLNMSPELYRKTAQMVSRLSFSLIISGTLIGSAMIIQANHSAQVERFAFLGIIGFGVALVSMVAFFMGSLK
ncbi:MAG: AarF/ABC1/UbiB kinase family protein [Syntrophomonadaceae bacterium]|nr:AarF/ABC1/UbiB kinase family protein [Syntrophomonadaceae bacterium]